MRPILWLGLLALLPSELLAAPHLNIRGNLVITEGVYRSIAALSEQSGTRSSTRTSSAAKSPAFVDMHAYAEDVRFRIYDFLKASGYDLSKVEIAEVGANHITLQIDEGKLDKIIVLGEGTYGTIKTKLQTNLPENVFNRDLLEKKLHAIVNGDPDITRAHYEVVPVRKVEHEGIQIDEPTIIRGVKLLDPTYPHELRITLYRDSPKQGASLKLGISGLDGLYGGVGYSGFSGLFDNDRYEVKTRVGFQILNTEFDSEKNPARIARASAEFNYYTPPLFGDVRSFFHFEADLQGRLREDLAIDNYYYLPLTGSLNFSIDFLGMVNLSIGAGAQGRLLFGVDRGDVSELTLAPDDTVEEVEMLIDDLIAGTPDREVRYFLDFSAVLEFNREELRLDRRHRLALHGRFLGRGGDGGTSRLRAITEIQGEYQKVFLFGWDEWWLRANGAHIWGTVPFYNDYSIGRGFIRGVFSSEVFIRRVFAVSTEYRLSLNRDYVKMSLYNDFAVFQRLDVRRESQGVGVADSFGLGLHVLIYDAFQLNTYVSLGFDQELGFDLGISARIEKAF